MGDIWSPIYDVINNETVIRQALMENMLYFETLAFYSLYYGEGGKIRDYYFRTLNETVYDNN